MSWSGFKKNVGRATTQVMMKTGHVEKTTNREYEVEERRYRTLESASLRLQKEARGYLDSLRAMTASQMRIAETIDAFYGDSGAKDGVSRSYKQAVEDLDAETVKALDGPYRCVDKDLYAYARDPRTGDPDLKLVEQIECEWAHNRSWTLPRDSDGAVSREAYDKAGQLMDIVYRTTVLEPINRFCAYFPDINECIKKRNHKMLDYDAMRSKVKRLVEKPDKDPAKLPRTEKETEMVSTPNYTHSTQDSLLPAPDFDLEHELLDVPSPPRILTRPDIAGLRREAFSDQEYVASRLAGRSSTSTTSSGVTPRSLGPAYSSSRASAARSQASDYSHGARSESRSSATRLTTLRESSTEALLPRATGPPTKGASFNSMRPSGLRSASTPGAALTEASRSANQSQALPQRSHGMGAPPSSKPHSLLVPSELEEMMRPLLDDYVRTQADLATQAKAAYEQLNEQLTTELPQLIDLRVPYLDPTFEALVKIQLRFCAEAYSRMAQVQQYLDASTRDQYASGDLDARVEDVLGQIRELSIAGTV